ncbi:unnamed protein product [Acanthoscelides obtectus]|uniref:Uncharacterized protein n=1 Tax=Acanthoscelides obtectus TaxID=200917 RepID=A0A9P0JMG7_ACAOB|nr:unnamed protein product [Acanthoscelides obtectus]CAK1665839.1 hypothetical protein AOBTE_LOCUS24997 [Acanthoscelides obtectus]
MSDNCRCRKKQPHRIWILPILG